MKSPRVEETFYALGDRSRLAVIGLLREGPQRSSDLAEALDLARPAMSKHLGVLRKAGLVEEAGGEAEGDGRERRYQLRQAPFVAMRGWLEEVEGFWSVQLSAFKAHAEKKGKGRPR